MCVNQNSTTQSIILPVHNAELWLDECLQSVVDQDCGGASLELSVFNDASTVSVDVSAITFSRVPLPFKFLLS